MMFAFLLTACILSSGFTGNIYKKLSLESPHPAISAWMTSVWFAPLSLFFAGAFLVHTKSKSPSDPIQEQPVLVGIAILSGVCIFLAACILIESMKKNSLSVSVIIINMNFIIPVLLSALFLHEKVSPVQILGVLLPIAVILILNLERGGKSAGDKPAGRWTAILLPLIACIANGLVNFFIKVNNNSEGNTSAFFAIMYLSAAISAIVGGIILRIGQRPRISYMHVCRKSTLPFLLLMSLCNGVCFYTTERIATYMNAAAQFTIVTALSIIMSLAVGILFQKETWTYKTGISLLFCFLALACQAWSIYS